MYQNTDSEKCVVSQLSLDVFYNCLERSVQIQNYSLANVNSVTPGISVDLQIV